MDPIHLLYVWFVKIHARRFCVKDYFFYVKCQALWHKWKVGLTFLLPSFCGLLIFATAASLLQLLWLLFSQSWSGWLILSYFWWLKNYNFWVKMAIFLKSMLSSNFVIWWCLKLLIIYWIFWWYLNRYYTMIYIRCYYLDSKIKG